MLDGVRQFKFEHFHERVYAEASFVNPPGALIEAIKFAQLLEIAIELGKDYPPMIPIAVSISERIERWSGLNREVTVQFVIVP